MTGETVEEEERARIVADVQLENRVKALEGKVDKILYGLGAAALLILTSIWDQLKAVVFK